MAFIGLIFMYLLFFLAILAAMAVVGTVFLLIGLLKRRKFKKRGERRIYPYVFIVIGGMLLSVPVSITLIITVMVVANNIKLNIQRMGYDNIVDEWKNEGASYRTPDKAVEEMLEASESSDKDAVMAFFTDTIQTDEELSYQIDEYFENYVSGLSDAQWVCVKERIRGENIWRNSEGYVYSAELDGEKYYITIMICTEYGVEQSEIGFNCFYITTDEEMAGKINYTVYIRSTTE